MLVQTEFVDYEISYDWATLDEIAVNRTHKYFDNPVLSQRNYYFALARDLQEPTDKHAPDLMPQVAGHCWD